MSIGKLMRRRSSVGTKFVFFQMEVFKKWSQSAPFTSNFVKKNLILTVNADILEIPSWQAQSPVLIQPLYLCKTVIHLYVTEIPHWQAQSPVWIQFVQCRSLSDS
jgi:hypothetical protein